MTLLGLLAAGATPAPPPDPTATWTARRQVTNTTATHRYSQGVKAAGATSVRVALDVRRDCKDVRVSFGGSHVAYDIQSAALEVDGTVHPLTFAGARPAAVPLLGHATTDTLPLTLTAGDTVYLRYSHYGTATPWCGGWGIAGGVWLMGAGNLVDTYPWVTAGSGIYPIFPSEVTGLTHPDNPSVLVLGDSITEGGNDNAGAWAVRGLNTAGVPYVNAAKWGQAMSALVSDAGVWTAEGLSQMGPSTFDAHTHAVCAFGTNDIVSRSVAQLQTTYTALWSALATEGLTVAQRTIPPVTTSTDSWATLENQTVSANEAKRLALNEWIRTQPSGVACIDSAAAVEHGGSSAPSGKWRIDAGSIAGDGTHPGPGGHALMAAPLTAWLNTL